MKVYIQKESISGKMIFLNQPLLLIKLFKLIEFILLKNFIKIIIGPIKTGSFLIFQKI